MKVVFTTTGIVAGNFIYCALADMGNDVALERSFFQIIMVCALFMNGAFSKD